MSRVVYLGEGTQLAQDTQAGQQQQGEGNGGRSAVVCLITADMPGGASQDCACTSQQHMWPPPADTALFAPWNRAFLLLAPSSAAHPRQTCWHPAQQHSPHQLWPSTRLRPHLETRLQYPGTWSWDVSCEYGV